MSTFQLISCLYPFIRRHSLSRVLERVAPVKPEQHSARRAALHGPRGRAEDRAQLGSGPGNVPARPFGGRALLQPPAVGLVPPSRDSAAPIYERALLGKGVSGSWPETRASSAVCPAAGPSGRLESCHRACRRSSCKPALGWSALPAPLVAYGGRHGLAKQGSRWQPLKCHLWRAAPLSCKGGLGLEYLCRVALFQLRQEQRVGGSICMVLP